MKDFRKLASLTVDAGLDLEQSGPEDPIDLWLATVRSGPLQSGAGALALAVLERALRDATLPPRSAKYRRLRADAVAWLGDCSDDGAFSVSHVCDVVGVNVDALRRQLRQLA